MAAPVHGQPKGATIGADLEAACNRERRLTGTRTALTRPEAHPAIADIPRTGPAGIALIKTGEAWLLSCHISPYSHSGYASHDPLRTRKLLLRREQIDKLRGRVEEKGLALVPVRIYFKHGRAKCELALVKGKKVWDRREEIRRRADDREIEQELKRYR